MEETEFQKSTSWSWWPGIPIIDLPNGLCYVEVSLNDVLWARVDFEVQP